MPHLAAVYRLARQLGGPEKADDLVQETFLRAWMHFNQFDPASNCRAWLLRILHNVWISQWRKTRLELPVADVNELHTEPYYDWERRSSFARSFRKTCREPSQTCPTNTAGPFFSRMSRN